MEWHKSIIGEIGVVKNKDNININLKIAQGMIPKSPKGSRIRLMESWEGLKLADKDDKSLKFLKPGYYFTYSNEKYYRASWLDRAGVGSWFSAVGRDVGFADYGLLGVLVVKEVKK